MAIDINTMAGTVTAAWFAVLGLVVGSFLNVVIFRLPRGFHLGLPSRSACAGCHRQLSWYENIPIVSYLFLRGRCRGCHSQISIRYPLVELMTGVLFLAVFRNFELSFATLYYCLFAAALLAVTFIDLDFRIIPDSISLPGIVVGVVLSPLADTVGLAQSLLGAVVGGGAFWLLGWLYEKIRHREGLGFGDVKLLAMIGAFLGVKGVIGTIVVSSLLGSVIGIIIMVAQRKDLKLAIPYGPFLAIGALTFLFWGDYLALRFYSQFYYAQAN